MTLPIIQSLWVGDQISLMEKLCISSFLANGHSFHLYVYNDVSNLPENVTLMDANKIIPESEIFTYFHGSYAGFADWFRWELLYQAGNFWVDTDIICLKPFAFSEDLTYGYEGDKLAGAAVLKFPQKHTICDELRNACSDPHKIHPSDPFKKKIKKFKRKYLRGNKRSDVGWGDMGGPTGFTNALVKHNLLDKAKPFYYFYPIAHQCWNSVFNEDFSNNQAFFNQSYAIHLWNEMMRSQRQAFDKNANFPQNSLIEQLKRKYL